MENKYIIAILTFFITFAISFVNLFFVGKSSIDENKKNILTYITCYIVLFISFMGIFFYSDKSDFIYDLNIFEPIVFFALAALIFFMYSWEKTKKIAFMSVIFGAICLYPFIPDNYNLFQNEGYVLLSKLSLIAIFFSLSFLYKYINSLEGLFAIQTFFIGLGIAIISFAGATPLTLGLWGIALFGIFLSFYTFNSYPSRLKISNAGVNSIGFIISWLLIRNSEESSLSCSILFSLYFIIEALLAIAKRLTLLQKYNDIYANTFAYQSNIRGLPVDAINNSVIKILILMLIMGCLQIYAPNTYSIPIFAAIIMLWFLNKLLNWDTPRQTLKEMNKSFVSDLKENISEVKKIINRD